MPDPSSSQTRAQDDEEGPLRTGAIEVARNATKRPEDTFAGCEALAASDLARAAMMDTANGSLKFRQSAASWQQRAELLQRLETSFKKRKALDKAEWERAEAAEQELESDKAMRDVRI
jgi:hypothetical protein